MKKFLAIAALLFGVVGWWSYDTGVISAVPKIKDVQEITADSTRSPDEVAPETIDLTKFSRDSASVEAWRRFADDVGLDCDDGNEIDLGICIDGDRIYSAYEMIVKAPVGVRGWIESRQAAAAAAELQAKAKIVAYLEQGVSGQQSMKEFEHFSEAVGDLKEVLPEEHDEWNDFADRLKVLAKKGVDFLEAESDRRIKQNDPFYDTDQYKKLPPKERIAVARRHISQKTVALAEELLRGAVPVFSHESVDSQVGKSRVLVAVAWTPNTKRVAASIGRGEYNAKAINPHGKKGAAKLQVPADESILLGTFGARMYLDEKGEHYILAFAQAEARRSQSHQEQAIKTAHEAAELRAKGVIARFVAEYIETQETEDSGDEVAEFSDQSAWRENRREYNKRVSARTKSVRLYGVHPVKVWGATHPATGQIVAGAVVKWSPTDLRQAAEIRRLIKQKDEHKTKTPAVKDYSSEPAKIDLDAY